MIGMVSGTITAIVLVFWLQLYALVDHLRADGIGTTGIEMILLVVLGIVGTLSWRSFRRLMHALREAGIERKGPPPSRPTDWRWEYVFLWLLAALT